MQTLSSPLQPPPGFKGYMEPVRADQGQPHVTSGFFGYMEPVRATSGQPHMDASHHTMQLRSGSIASNNSGKSLLSSWLACIDIEFGRSRSFSPPQREADIQISVGAPCRQ